MPQAIIIRGGDVYDGSGDPPQHADIRIEGETITAIETGVDSSDAQVVDASGLIVCPGLIDLHVHVCDGVGIYSIPPAQAGIETGVTAMLDAGSAGCLTYEAFHRYVMPSFAEDVFALLNISQLGVQGNPMIEPFVGELTDVRHVHVASCVECGEQYRDRIVGTKARLSSNLAAENPENEWAALRGVVDAGHRLGVPCMIHHKGSNISVASALRYLRPGDMYTHVFHPDRGSGFTSDTGEPLPEMLEARERGILFDVGHGIGSFSWQVAERAYCDHGFWPDTISTDIHRLNVHGPVHDLPTTMSKFLLLGMPLTEVIHRSTLVPAKAMRIDEQFGLLRVGRQADIALLRLENGRFALRDVLGESRDAPQRLTAEKVVKRGTLYDCALLREQTEAARRFAEKVETT